MASMLLVLLITMLWLCVAYAFHRAARQLPAAAEHTTNPFRSRAYWLAVLAQGIAIPLVSRLLSASGHPDAIMPAIAMIVGAHLFGLIPAFGSWYFALVGGMMVLLGAISLTFIPAVAVGPAGTSISLRTAVVGFGCALILWGSIVPIVATVRR
jgi:hypothetical protein